MKATLIAVVSFLAVSLVIAEEALFSDAAPEPLRPVRNIVGLPKSVSYQLSEGKHVYVVKGIYAGSLEHNIVDRSYGEMFIPECEDCIFDFEERVCTIRTKRKLTYSELAYAIDDIAKLGADMPYWVELEARDIPKTNKFTNLEFKVEEYKGDFPKQLAWFGIPKEASFEMPLRMSSHGHFKVLVVPTTAYCMCHSRYCIRILDENNKLVWSDSTIAYAGISVAVTAADELSPHEVLIRRFDHGQGAKWVIKLKTE